MVDLQGKFSSRISNVEEQLGKIEAGLEEQRVVNNHQGADIQKLLLHDKSLSDEERILAGQQYLKYGGNGPTGLYVAAMVKAYAKRVEKKMGKDVKIFDDPDNLDPVLDLALVK
jgi:hypothetical protein